MPQDLSDQLDNKSRLFWVMAWCLHARSHYLNLCWPRSQMLYIAWLGDLGHNEFSPKADFRIVLGSLTGLLVDSFVYTSGHCRRWCSRMEVKIMAGSLFVHCKIVYFYSVITEKWLVVSLPNFVMIRGAHLSISCKIFSWIHTTKLKIYAMEFCDFI